MASVRLIWSAVSYGLSRSALSLILDAIEMFRKCSGWRLQSNADSSYLQIRQRRWGWYSCRRKAEWAESYLRPKWERCTKVNMRRGCCCVLKPGFVIKSEIEPKGDCLCGLYSCVADSVWLTIVEFRMEGRQGGRIDNRIAMPRMGRTKARVLQRLLCSAHGRFTVAEGKGVMKLQSQTSVIIIMIKVINFIQFHTDMALKTQAL